MTWLNRAQTPKDSNSGAAEVAQGMWLTLETGRSQGAAAGAGGPALAALPFVRAGGAEHDPADPSAQGFFRNADECILHARPHFL